MQLTYVVAGRVGTMTMCQYIVFAKQMKNIASDFVQPKKKARSSKQSFCTYVLVRYDIFCYKSGVAVVE